MIDTAAIEPSLMKPSAHKTTARFVGILFLVAIVAYATGNGLIQALLNAPDSLSLIAAKRTQMGLGALLMVANSVVVVSIGVLLLPILETHSRVTAFGYLSARLIESVTLSVGVLSLLSLIPVSQESLKAQAPGYFQTMKAIAIQNNVFAYQIAMIALGLGSLMFCSLLYRRRLIPRLLATWGLIGYAVFLTGAILEFVGFAGVGLTLSIPGGLFELVLGLWLIVKGFSPAKVEVEPYSSKQ